MTLSPITQHQISNNLRIQHTADAFGMRFPLNIEPAVYAMASRMAPEYRGAYWEFYTLSNGGFYMAPHSDKPYSINCDNGYEGVLSAEALGMTVCLYAYSHLSFSSNEAFAEICANHYHWLRAYALAHKEARAILMAID